MPEELMSPSPTGSGMDSAQPAAMDAAPQMPASDDPNKIVITEEDTKPTEIVPDPTGETPAPAMDPAPWSPGSTPMGAEQPAQGSESVASTPEAIKEMSTADAIITLAKAANLSPEDSKKIAEELSK